MAHDVHVRFTMKADSQEQAELLLEDLLVLRLEPTSTEFQPTPHALLDSWGLHRTEPDRDSPACEPTAAGTPDAQWPHGIGPRREGGSGKGKRRHLGSLTFVNFVVAELGLATVLRAIARCEAARASARLRVARGRFAQTPLRARLEWHARYADETANALTELSRGIESEDREYPAILAGAARSAKCAARRRVRGHRRTSDGVE